MEALALRVPVIASAARGNSELVPPDSGIVVPIGDVHGLAAAMDWLIEHPNERAEMGRRGRVRMVERYDIGKLIDLHDDLYRGLLAERQTINS
jgi:glycosyltransferase involved in cell wall biosynthesis